MHIIKYSILLVSLLSIITLAQNVEQLIKLGDDEVDVKYDYLKGLEYYNQALEIEPQNVRLLNKISRAIVFIGDNLPANLEDIETELKFGQGMNEDKESLDSSEITGAQIENYEKAYELACKAIEIDPTSAEAYLRRAIANARIAVTKGIFTVAKLVNQVKHDLELAIKLGQKDNGILAVAHYVLAKTHDKVSDKWKPARSIIGLGWGDFEIALKEYKKAIKLKPNVRAFYLDYAKALLEEGKEDEAKKMLEKVETCPFLDAEDDKRLEEAKILLASL